MKEDLFSWELYSKAPIVGIVRNVSFEDLKNILPQFYDAGLTNIEITMNTVKAQEMIRYVLDNYSSSLNIGAGTVCDNDDLNKALDAGAQFIVTPIINENVILNCVDRKIPIFPGAFTPSEIYKAWSLGASMIKIFPSTTVGPSYIKELKGPLDQIRLLPTGGVTLENIESFRKVGSDGFGIGSQLFNTTLIKEKNWEGLNSHFRKFVMKVQPSR